ncbi:MAG: MBL fold metallo-hydrolase [Deltaproteobacteria bacterium]|nr:MBL fold metallo-hydrolase [Deltaproteobacteria bacterium]
MAGIVIDPGDDANEILATIEKRGVKVTAIYNTHGHFDHIGAVHPLQNSLDVPFALHRGDAELAASASTQGQMFGLHLPMSPPKVDVWLEDDMAIIVGEQKGKVLHTPGHTQGGVCFLFSDMVFVGDTLFAGSVGRTDLPGGNSRQLIASIQQKLMSLDDTVKVFPGHGPVTSIGKERKFNPFINYNGTF